jgi:hypothetical protein
MHTYIHTYIYTYTYIHTYIHTYIAFNGIPKSSLYHEAEEEPKQQWQSEWEKCAKAAITKQYFPTVQDRLNIKISMTPTMAAMVTGHGKTRA